jgi:hypothetical protein
MASVCIDSGTNTIPASDLIPGQLGVIVASPHQALLGRIVIGLCGTCDNAYALLDTGSVWSGSNKTNRVRVLDKNEKVILQN